MEYAKIRKLCKAFFETTGNYGIAWKEVVKAAGSQEAATSHYEKFLSTIHPELLEPGDK